MTRLLLGLALCLVLAPSAAVGQCTVGTTGSCTQSRPITLTVNHAVEMTLSATTTTLTSPGAAAYTQGYTVDPGPSITVKANGAWRLNVKANAGTWTGTGALANPSKAAADLLVGTASTGPFTALSVSDFQLALGSVATAGTAVAVFYKTLWAWTTDSPGTYSLGVTFTIVSP